MMRPVPRAQHRAADDLGANEAVGEIEVDEALPGLEVGVLDRHVEIASADIVDEDVDRPRLREHACAEVLARAGSGDVARQRSRPCGRARAPHRRSCARAGRVAAIQHDVGARLCGRQRDDPAEAAAAAGDEKALAVQPEAIEHFMHAASQLAHVMIRKSRAVLAVQIILVATCPCQPSTSLQARHEQREGSDDRTKGTGIHPATGGVAQQLLQGTIDRREFLTRSLVAGLGLAGVGAVAKIGVRSAFAAGSAADADLLSVDRGPASRHPGGEREVPGPQLPDRAGRGFRHRALRGRGQKQGKHLGRLCRPDAVRRNVGDDQGRRHRAVGQLHPEGRARRHHPVDPRGVHDRRQALRLALPARRDRQGLAFGPDRPRPACPTPRPRPGTTSWPTPRRSSIPAPRRSAPPSTPMAGARSRRSRTA